MNRITLALLIWCGSNLQLANGIELLFGDPRNAGSPVNGPLTDHSHLSADGQSLYVARGTLFQRTKMYVSERSGVDGQSWGPLRALSQNVSDDGSIGVPTLTADELSIFYSDQTARWGPILREGLGGGDIWTNRRSTADSGWETATNIGAPVNSEYLESDPSISADGLSLFFTSDRPGGFGAHDIWTSRRASIHSEWEEPLNLGPTVNGPDSDWTPSISHDGLTLFYATRGAQLPDLWVTSRTTLDGDWGAPVSLGRKINTSFAEIAPQLSADGSTFYYSHYVGNEEFDVFSVPLLPFETVSVRTGSEAYSEDFDGLGINSNSRGTILPTGWTVSDNETVFSNATDLAFPVSRSFGSGGNPILNAGAQGDSDRTLAIGARDRVEGGMIQLLADVAGGDATSIQLKFDIEAWDARNSSRTDDPGEAAFQVHVDIDRGDGYKPLADLGTVTTGVLATPTDDYLNGNAAENRVSFDSGQVDGSIPAGSKLRLHWHIDRDAQTNNWVFGLDNVNLALFDTSVTVDIDALSAEVRAGTNNPLFDLNGDGFVDDTDRTIWVQDIAGTFFGDADLNKEVNFADFLAVSNAFGGDGGWSQGDFDGNGSIDFPDFLVLSGNFGSTAQAAAVPEPTATSLVLIGMLGLIGCGRKGRRRHY